MVPRGGVQEQTSLESTTAPVLGGLHVPAGAAVATWAGAANHDEQQPERPETFDITRIPNPHEHTNALGPKSLVAALGDRRTE
ncbi:hypothetical protein ABZ746_35685 [Streptomyces sp. NPDC020096]